MVGAAAVAAIGIMFACSESAAAEAEKQKEDAIRELMVLTGAGDLGTQMMEQMGAALAAGQGDDFQAFWTDFSERIEAGDLIEMVVPIYAKHFELAEIEEVIRFNKTPVGKKFVRVMPDIMQESMAAGMEWGQALAGEAMEAYEQREDK